MSRESGQDRSQKTVAELLALHGGQVEGKRRHRRAADEAEEAPPAGGDQQPPRRGRGVSDTGPQAIIDRVRGGEGQQTPPPSGRRRKPDGEAPPAPPQQPPARPNGNQQPSGTFQRPANGAVPPEPGAFGRPGAAPPPQQDSGGYPRPQQESGAFQRPPEAGGTGYQRPPQAPPRNGGGPDSGGFPRPQQESGAFPRNGSPEPTGFQRPPESGAFPRPVNGNGPDSGGFPRPVNGGQESGAFQRPPAPESGAFPLPPRRQRPPARPPEPEKQAEETRQVPPLRPAPQQNSLSARLDGLEAGAPEDAADPGPPPGGMASGAFQAPPRRPRRPGRQRPEPEPHTEQFEAVGDQQPPEAAVPPDAPPAGLSRWRRQRDQVSSEDTEVGVMPVLPEGHPSAFNPPPVLPEGHPSAFTPAPQLEDEAMEATGFHDPFADDDEEVDEFGDFGEAEPERLGGHEYEAEAEPEAEEEAEESDSSPAKQWLSMAAQLALGVLGGAAVWLGFNWLWGQIPAAALVAALVVVVGLVWIVRKIRRADDIQTMVLAVLVGLVVTVSPAALLLLSR
ncbi:hypothetical protein FPZ12_006335 [Amycolatopsis acidicola]|uniref:Uncharacterized protein n=1 Tax=Amycolatopsis acidicola TaxID=2596893 RepID=A0A5N0VEX2_9PSEU|nr:hypothetical protein [Amycolatopsis acidicola]KAA9164879.1 hypothetical protein FPZ12_006335 [Amycolatopsis acidicola]